MTPSNPGQTANVPWKDTQPSSRVVQKHYVNARVHELNRTMTDRYREGVIDLLLTDLAADIARMKPANKRIYCGEIYDIMTAVLQKKDLTVNFKAYKWFTTENRYETYSQMYERGIDSTTGEMFLTDSDPLNPANTRAMADDRITFPQHWSNPTAPLQRGLSPGIQPTHAITSRMLTGEEIPTSLRPDDTYLNSVRKADGSEAFTSKNKKLNPKAKQVFAALNYGGRPHGSSIQYGMSYFVLNPNLKVDAIYFPGDTFYIPSADHQASYKTLGGLYLHAKPMLRQLLLPCCMSGMRLEDTSQTHELVEAHLFQKLRFANGISELRLEPTTDYNILANVRKFCDRWGIRLRRMG